MAPLPSLARSLPMLLDRRSVYYLVHVTGRCNARCDHCFYWRETDTADKSQEIRLDEFEQIARQLGPALVINFCGGEPYLREDLCEIVRSFVSSTSCLLVTIPSNGLMTDRIVSFARRICTENPGAFFRFSFSLDGPERDHDAIRGVPGSFVRVCETIHRVSELHGEFNNFALLTSTIFSAQTQDHILDFLDWIHNNLPVDQSNLTFVRGSPREAETLKVDPLIYRQAAEWMRQHRSAGATRRAPESLLSRSIFLETLETVEKAHAKQGTRVFRCPAGQKMLLIDRGAEVLPCELLGESRSMGNLRNFNYDINALLASPQARGVARWIRQKHCSCTWECAIQASKAFDPTQWPALGMRTLSLMLRRQELG